MIRKTPFSIRLLLWPIILPAVIRKLSYLGARPYNSAPNSLRDTASTLQAWLRRDRLMKRVERLYN